MDDRNASQGQMEVKLQEWGAKLDEMREKANQVEGDAKAGWDKKIDELTAKRDAVQQKLAELKASSDDAWVTMKTGMQATWDELSNAFEEAASKF